MRKILLLLVIALLARPLAAQPPSHGLEVQDEEGYLPAIEADLGRPPPDSPDAVLPPADDSETEYKPRWTFNPALVALGAIVVGGIIAIVLCTGEDVTSPSSP